ncbi:unnamed protein product [Chrysodeixis includens]|uniref:CARD domain-containing protein n=1 Tax=Chrysodeixis includens TaxID=689277 RepID=A0A9P0BTC3_CHRIL|nr:unnamed protein product [Chrysodeixis includens]
MDNNKRMLLQRYQQDIINDLDVNYIVDELYTKHAISSEEVEHIFRLPSRVDQTRFLLDTIRNGNNGTYESFVDSLIKDYNWLWKKFTVENNNPMPNDSLEDSLSKGDVPRLPDHHARRAKIEQNVAERLKLLPRHKILVLHGMSGSGKTCVVLSVLRDNPDLVTNTFNGVVFWLNFGNCKTDDDIIFQQSKLLRKASSIYTQNSYMNSSVSMSSIGSNGDSHSSSTYEWTMDDLRDKLKAQFSEQPLKESLLVLDEVNDKKCLGAFDIGCKILVTTRDTDVVANFHPQIIKIENSLEERESLEIFASSLDMQVSQLPWQAKKLHEICKGSPFNIGLIGAQLAENKERLMHDPKRWNYYIKKLEKKEHFLFIPKNQAYNPRNTIEVCCNSLNETVLPLFKKLKILPDNVKVSARVLSKLWNKDERQVESIIKELHSKSLISQFYDREQRNYMYEIHDLIMDYLRTTGEDNSKLHAEFLNSYKYYNTNPPVEIVDDGYIAFFIGYHIKHTDNLNDKYGLFNKLFLNLKFLGNKVRLTGPADVMSDLQKYENNIVTNELERDLLINIRGFLSTHGTDLYHYPCTDIVQSILQNDSRGILYSKASQLAQENCNNNELYFEFLHEHNVDEIKHSTIDVKEKITAVCFLGDYVLVGTNSGVIKFFHIPTNKLRKELRGTGSPIKWIGVACTKSPPIVAALAYDGVVKLWYVDDVDYDDTEDVIEEESEEVCNKNYADTETIIGAYLNCRWTNNEEYLIMHTNKKITFYIPQRHKTNKILKPIQDFERDQEVLCCVPCNHDKYVFVATDGNTKCVEVIDLKTKERVITFEETDIVLDMVTVPGSNKIITLKANEILEHEVKVNINSMKSNTWRCRRVISSDDIKDNLSFLSIAVNKTGTLLFVSTDDSRVVCVDLKTYTRSFDLENRRGNVVAMAVSEMLMWDDFEPGSDVLLTGTGCVEDSAKVWYLDASYISQMAQRNGRVRLTTKFDVSFVNPVSPQSPNIPTPNSGTESAHNTPKRHQSFANHKEVSKTLLKNTMSLDRHSLKPLNLQGICNNNDSVLQPLLAVVDDKNNIQVMRGRKVLTEITEKSDEYITRVKISPCNQYIIYGLKSGAIKKYTLRTKEIITIMDVYSPVQYLNFVNPNLMIVAGKNTSLMAYRLTSAGNWKPEMMQRGNNNLGSQEILNDIQGFSKKKNGHLERLSSSSSETSICSRDRAFPNGDVKNLCRGSILVDCFWVPDLGIITVESNATIKLWDRNLKLLTILNGRQAEVMISSAAFRSNILVITDKHNKAFQTFELKVNDEVELETIQEYRLNNVIVSCELTADGHILAMGLCSGNVVIWNVKGRRQLSLLKHHKSKVHWCSFSPVPERSNRNSFLASSPHPVHSPTQDDDVDTENPPLVLVTMATEIVWWNITHVMKAKKFKMKISYNAMTPIGSPLESRCDTPNTSFNSGSSSNRNVFFGDSYFVPHQCWKAIWKGKTCKEGSKRKEILACIKLSGMNAKRLSHDDKFSCFVTVDNPGHIHIMNVMRSNNT